MTLVARAFAHPTHAGRAPTIRPESGTFAASRWLERGGGAAL